jgi:uncharacterized Zn-binding protein involved in type VI secretion
MPRVARVGDSITTGHLCDTTSTIASSGHATNVFANGKLVALQGGPISPHQIESQRGVQPPGPPTNPSTCIPHSAVVIGSSTTVRANGRFIARQDDRADEGRIEDGAYNVFAN